MNRCWMVGYMTENPEHKDTKNGKGMTRFKISVKKKRVVEGQPKYNYFQCVAFDKTADFIYKYFNSQSRIAIIGTIDNYSYTVNGAKRYGTQILVDDAEIISTTVNQGDHQDSGMEQYQEQPGQFEEVDDPQLPFL